MTLMTQAPTTVNGRQNSAAPTLGGDEHEKVVRPRRYELQAETAAGKRLVSTAEHLAADFATRAAEHDREASFPHEAIDALKASGYFSAQIPKQFGGLGVESIRDLLIASSRLARGDASVTIGVNMHHAAAANIVRRYKTALASGNERLATILGGIMRMLVQSGAVLAAAVSEPAQDLTRPATRAERSGDGWVINGRKIFCTMSPAATSLVVAATVDDPQRGELYAYVMVPSNSQGVVYHDDWDALGMRASGSQSVSFQDVTVPDTAVRGGFPVGDLSGMLERNLTAGAFHAAASLGIAEEAHELVMSASIARRKENSESATTVMLASQNAIDVAAMRGIFDRAGRLIDDYYAEYPASAGAEEEITAVYSEVQAAKTFINEASVRVVDRALTLSGGAGYMSKHPLSRAYRDVRAGAFMHPLGANRAYEFIGHVTLALTPSLS
jgi:alkylation response protein AidB-like acyl-CoA dehydrogenase